MVVAENCVHQLRSSFQSSSSVVLEAGVGVLVMEVAICLFGFDIGVRFGKWAVAGTCAQCLRSASSPLINILSKLLCFDELQILFDACDGFVYLRLLAMQAALLVSKLNASIKQIHT